MDRVAVFLLLPLLGAQTLKLGPVSPKDRTAAEAAAKPGVKAASIHRPITPKMLEKGKWKENVWRLKIVSKQAAGVRLLVNAKQGKLLVKGKDQKNAQTFDQFDGEFWTAVTHGDTVWVEFTAPRRQSTPPLEIKTLSHIYP
ncbi:MAG: hypothetical protein FJW30_24565 [Acidobacteria bacterium]|nr:hypothetical protein [Acidobacteriota bacterium]